MFRWLPRGLAGDQKAAVQMRLAGSRLRVALPLLAPKPRGRRVRRALRVLRELTRATRDCCDLGVNVALFDERLKSLGPPTRERARLRQRLGAARRRSRDRMVETLMDLEIARLRSDLRALLSRRVDDPFVILGRLRQASGERARALLAGIEAIGDCYDPDGLLRLRGRARRLCHTAELSGALRGQDSGAPALLKEVQEQLGLIHDNHVLAAWFEAQAAAAASENVSLTAEARAQAAFFKEASRACHRALLQRRPLELVRQTIQVMRQTLGNASAHDE